MSVTPRTRWAANSSRPDAPVFRSLEGGGAKHPRVRLSAMIRALLRQAWTCWPKGALRPWRDGQRLPVRDPATRIVVDVHRVSPSSPDKVRRWSDGFGLPRARPQRHTCSMASVRGAQPVLTGSRVLLRPWAPVDAEDV